MGQEERIQNAYRGLGGKRTFYDGMITCSTLSGRAVCRLVWGMGRAETQDYLCAALSGIPEGFSGRLLEVPVGTGILTMPLYREMPEAEITCLDYSPEMLERAKSRGEGLAHVRFQQGDVGALPFGNSSFDIVLSLNGFHAFPDKEAAWREIFRVLRPGGTFCGCFYVRGQNRRTDWLIRRLYVPKGWFTPPFETAESLRRRLEETFGPAKVRTVSEHGVLCLPEGEGGTPVNELHTKIEQQEENQMRQKRNQQAGNPARHPRRRLRKLDVQSGVLCGGRVACLHGSALTVLSFTVFYLPRFSGVCALPLERRRWQPCWSGSHGSGVSTLLAAAGSWNRFTGSFSLTWTMTARAVSWKSAAVPGPCRSVRP